MQWFRNFKMFYKILTLVGVMSLTLVGVGVIGYIVNSNSQQNLDNLYNKNLLSIQYIEEAMVQNRVIEGIVYKLFLVPDENAIPALEQEMQDRLKKYDAALTAYSKVEMEPYETERWPIYQEALAKYREERQIAFDLADSIGREDGYRYFQTSAVPHLDELNMVLRELIDYNAQRASEVIDENKAKYQKSVIIIAGMTLGAIILGLIIGLMIARMISKPLQVIVQNIREIAQGNLTIENIQVDSKDEMGELGKAINMMANNLRSLVKQVSESAEQVASSSEELTASAEQQSEASNQAAYAITNVAAGAEKQSGAVDETSSAIEQMSASIQQIAASSNQVADETNKAAVVTRNGQKAVDNAVEQMKSVGEGSEKVKKSIEKLSLSSNEISEITDVIAGIADQTNLLALNAAIEAARAGDQGRGFAVVAEEVRKLAEQSQEAAKKITTLISENELNIKGAVSAMESGARDVTKGIEVVTTAGGAFAEIAAAVNMVSTQVQEISATIQQMAGGSQQIVSSIREIDQISKLNLEQAQNVSSITEEQAASVEQIASASQSLAKLAQDLQLAIGKFKV